MLGRARPNAASPGRVTDPRVAVGANRSAAKRRQRGEIAEKARWNGGCTLHQATHLRFLTFAVSAGLASFASLTFTVSTHFAFFPSTTFAVDARAEAPSTAAFDRS